MAGSSNPRKFKDRIALLEQRQAESTAQYNEVMKDVSEVKKPKPFPGNFDGGGGDMMIPRHLAPSLPNHHPHFRYGGSLPNVNQMATPSPPVSSPAPDLGPASASQEIQFAMSGIPQMPPSVPLDPCSGLVPGGAELGDPHQLRGAERSRGGGQSPGGGGGAIRNRSGERRWDPYSDRLTPQQYYSSSLVTTYLSPPPEARWRRTSSDSALYQKLTAPSSPTTCPSPTKSEHGSPEYSSASEDIKPPPELLQTLLRDPAPSLHTVKEEAAQLQQLHQLQRASCHPAYTHHSGSSSPVSPVAAVSPLYTAPAAYQHPAPALHHNQLEEKFQKFRLDCQPQFQDSGGSYLQHTNPATPTTGPTSPHTPVSALPDIYIQDWSHDCDKSLDAADLGLEPIDDQLLATLTHAGTFVDPAVEEQFKINY